MNKPGHFIPKKSLGQNFLVNPIIAEKIVAACNLKPEDQVLEIGPGKGALTHALSKRAKTVIAVEKDIRLAAQLQKDFEHTNTNIVHDDFLKYSFNDLPNPIKVIGNLPYNIATPIIKKLIDHREKFKELYLTVQWEYGQRLVAKPGSKSYGSFSCFVQYYSDAEILFKISKSAFHPVPKVQSCFICLTPRKTKKFKVRDEGLLFEIIRACFGQRRKTILNSLGSMIDKKRIPHYLQLLELDPKLRAENLSLDDYVRIANAVGK